MKSLYLIVSMSLLLCSPLKAEERVYERVYIHTDKDCYIAGETVLLKFYVIHSDFQPSVLSKVGYIEICDTEKPRMQLKVALEKGRGAGTIKIPRDIPSGMYQLSGYTRYMRNEGEIVFFKKQIAIVNTGQPSLDPKRFQLVAKQENIPSVEKIYSSEKALDNLLIKTDQNDYGHRMKVILSINNIPENTADLTVSVSRNDSIAFVPEVNKQEWLKQVKDTFHFSQQWIPEYEGHIISGCFVPKLQEEALLSNITFVGKDIRYFNGQINSRNGTADFYTAGIFGEQQIVTSVVSPFYEKVPYRLDLLTPFAESLPGNLAVLPIYPNEKQLIERQIGVQIQEKMDSDSLNNPIQSADYCTFQPILSYDLDEYTRFATISETILEFVNRVRVSKIGNNRKISVYLEEIQRFSLRTLVLLDGIPVYNHEDILAYNPMYLKKINIYDGRYLFGSDDLECIVSFITREGNLPFFQLNEGAQLFNYDCPQLPLPFKIPDYSIDEIRDSGVPDLRHTLYWNPFGEFTHSPSADLSFYTSDLCGEFKVTVEGITTDGKMIRGVSYFRVDDMR